MSSDALTPRRVETLFWLFLFSALVVGIGIESDWGQRWALPLQQIDVQPASFTKPSLTEPFSLPAADTFLEIALRPIFVVTRRPAPTAAIEPPKPRMKKDQFMLTGTTIVPEGKFAHLLEKTGNKSHVLAEGKEINGILIKEIRSDRIVLSQHDETETVMLYVAKAPKLPPQAPQPTTSQSPQPTPTPAPQQPAAHPAPASEPPSRSPGPGTSRPTRSATRPIPLTSPNAK